MNSLSPYLPKLATIIDIESQTAMEKVFSVLPNDGAALNHKPGQFVEVSVLGIGECPISVCSSPQEGRKDFELCVRKAGTVTQALHNLKVGDQIGIRGPFGTSFPVEEIKGHDLLFVAAGLGVAPLRSFFNYALQKRSDYGRMIIMIGCRTPNDMLFKNDLTAWRERPDMEYLETVDVCDSSWTGNVGVITTLLPKVQIDPARTYALMVGPPIMYRFAIAACKTGGLADDHIIVSLERRMKCGQGKCGHCQMGPIYACQEGPVFNYARIKDLKEAWS